MGARGDLVSGPEGQTDVCPALKGILRDAYRIRTFKIKDLRFKGGKGGKNCLNYPKRVGLGNKPKRSGIKAGKIILAFMP